MMAEKFIYCWIGQVDMRRAADSILCHCCLQLWQENIWGIHCFDAKFEWKPNLHESLFSVI